MKNITKGMMCALVLAASLQVNARTIDPVKTKMEETKHEPEAEARIPAVRLISNPDGTSSFQEGWVPTLKHMNTTTFWINNSVEDWEKDVHKAPRKQYVVTLKGRIKFKVSNGSTFILRPGVILLAEDTTGVGHSWEMEDADDNTWVRLYIPITNDADDFFVKNTK
ncbi:hypothetical protein [Sphingobacterium sp. MYb382]|uniref:hypothetical protein n=1 Tax=Sphingobacterium sp. MYb382 TaxID=2745278 RepID=UPI0030AFB176